MGKAASQMGDAPGRMAVIPIVLGGSTEPFRGFPESIRGSPEPIGDSSESTGMLRSRWGRRPSR
jgi:hypothetical protein